MLDEKAEEKAKVVYDKLLALAMKKAQSMQTMSIFLC